MKVMKVRATKLGYYLDQRRRPGDVFEVDESQFSERWMERADAQAQLKKVKRETVFRNLGYIEEPVYLSDPEASTGDRKVI